MWNFFIAWVMSYPNLAVKFTEERHSAKSQRKRHENVNHPVVSLFCSSSIFWDFRLRQHKRRLARACVGGHFTTTNSSKFAPNTFTFMLMQSILCPSLHEFKVSICSNNTAHSRMNMFSLHAGLFTFSVDVVQHIHHNIKIWNNENIENIGITK